jgi:serine/threonine protein kinase
MESLSEKSLHGNFLIRQKMARVILADDYPVTIPAHFFGYTFVSIIGSGSFSIVILAAHDETGDPFAVKILARQFLVDHNYVEQFQRELTLFSSFSHPNIVKFISVSDDDNLIYVMMEYCPLGNLHELIINQGAFSESVARTIVRQILEAVAYLHSLRVAHRDLKPENILICESSKIKLADFGFSREATSGLLFRTQCGSPLYASPEVISSIPYDGSSADMWSVGVIIFVLVTGRVPWEDLYNQNKLFYDIQTARYHIPETLSQNLTNLLNGLMNPQPMMRFTAAQALTHPWVLDCTSSPSKESTLTVIRPRQMGSSQNLQPTGALVMQSVGTHRDQFRPLARPKVAFGARRPPETHRLPPVLDAV